MSAKSHLKYLTVDEYDQWDQFVDRSPEGGIYSTSYYLQALCAAAGTQFSILTLWKGTEIVAGIGLHYQESCFGRIVKPRGLLYYNGFVLRPCKTRYPSKATSQRMHLMEPLLYELESDLYAEVTLSHRSPLTDMRLFCWHTWLVYPQYTYIVPIEDMDALWQRTDQNLRRLVNRCNKQGLRYGMVDDFKSFYRLHKETYARRNLEPYFSFERFSNLYQTLLQHNCVQMYAVWMPDGEIAAMQIVLSSGHNVSHTWSAATDSRFLRAGASALLRWKVFEDQQARGFTHNDLTDAMQPDVARFKGQLGADLVPFYVATRTNSTLMRLSNKISSNLIQPVLSCFKVIGN